MQLITRLFLILPTVIPLNVFDDWWTDIENGVDSQIEYKNQVSPVKSRKKTE